MSKHHVPHQLSHSNHMSMTCIHSTGSLAFTVGNTIIVVIPGNAHLTENISHVYPSLDILTKYISLCNWCTHAMQVTCSVITGTFLSWPCCNIKHRCLISLIKAFAIIQQNARETSTKCECWSQAKAIGSVQISVCEWSQDNLWKMGDQFTIWIYTLMVGCSQRWAVWFGWCHHSYVQVPNKKTLEAPCNRRLQQEGLGWTKRPMRLLCFALPPKVVYVISECLINAWDVHTEHRCCAVMHQFVQLMETAPGCLAAYRGGLAGIAEHRVSACAFKDTVEVGGAVAE